MLPSAAEHGQSRVDVRKRIILGYLLGTGDSIAPLRFDVFGDAREAATIGMCDSKYNKLPRRTIFAPISKGPEE